MTPGTQLLGLLLATNRTVNVGPPASPLAQDQQHPGLVWGGKGGGLSEPRPILPSFTRHRRWAELQHPVCPWETDLPRAPN